MRSPFELGRSILPRSPGRQLRVEQEILEEIEFHLDCRTEANRECGMTEEDARAAALEQFGDPENVLDACVAAHDGHLGRRFTRFAARVLPIGLAIGFAVAVTVILYSMVIRLPATYPDHGNWVVLWWQHAESGVTTSDSSIEDFETWRTSARTAEYVALGMYRPVVSEVHGKMERLMGKYVAYDYLLQHEIRPTIGRTFTGDAIDEALRPIVISHAFWDRRFDCAPKTVGSKIDIDGIEHTIVGVAPRGYQTFYPFDYFAPFEFENQDRTARRYLVSARLKPGVNLEEAQKDFASLDPATGEDAGWEVLVRRPQEVYGGAYPRQLIPYGVLSLMLLIVVIVKGQSQARRATGFGLTSILAGVATVGVLTALGTTELLRNSVLAGIDQRFKFGIDPAILTGFVVLIVVTVLAAERPRISHRRGRMVDSPASPRRVSAALVLTNALAFLMLVSAVILTNDWWQRRSPELGFDVDNVFTLPLLLSEADFADRQTRWTFFGESIEAIDAIEAVDEYSFTIGFPTMTEPQVVSMVLPDMEAGAGEKWSRIATRAVGPDYFKTIGINALAGKPFERSPHDGPLGAAVVNAAMAAEYWPDGTAIGRRIRMDGVRARFEITAVVDNAVTSAPGDEKKPVLYPLIWHWTLPRMVVVRTERDFQQVADDIRSRLTAVSSKAVVGAMRPANDGIRTASRSRAVTATFLWFSALLALALSSSFTFRSVRIIVDKGVRLLTFKRPRRLFNDFAFRPLMLGIAASVIVGSLLSSPLSYLLVTELSLQAQAGVTCVILPAALLITIHFAAAYIPFRQFRRVVEEAAPSAS
jgi:putative ABC transport system permease protein